MPWTFSASYPSRARSAASARCAIMDHLRGTGLSGRSLEDLECAVGEALANAIEHGCGFKGRLHVRCSVDDEAVVVEIEDSGTGFDDQRRHSIESDECRGRGIHIMRYLMDDVNYHNGGTLVRLIKKVREGV